MSQDLSSSRKKRITKGRQASECYDTNYHIHETFGRESSDFSRKYESTKLRFDSMSLNQKQLFSHQDLSNSRNDMGVYEDPSQRFTNNESDQLDKDLPSPVTCDHSHHEIQIERQNPYSTKRLQIINKSQIQTSKVLSPKMSEINRKEERTSSIVTMRRTNRSTTKSQTKTSVNQRGGQSDFATVKNNYNKLLKDYNQVKQMYDKIDKKLADTYIKLNGQALINDSLTQELKQNKSMLDKMDKTQKANEKKILELQDENLRLHRTIIQGPKGQIIADQNKELRDKLKQIEVERNQYETYYNQQTYELKKKENHIRLLENAMVNIILQVQEIKHDKKADKSDLFEDANFFLQLSQAQSDYDCERKLRQKLAERMKEMEKTEKVDKQKISELKFLREKDNEELIKLELEIKNLNTELIKLTQEKKDLVESYQAKEAKLNKQNQEYKQEMQKHKAMAEVLERDNKILAKRITKKQRSNDTLKQKYSEVEDKYKKQVNEMGAAIAELTENYKELQMRLESHSSKHITTSSNYNCILSQDQIVLNEIPQNFCSNENIQVHNMMNKRHSEQMKTIKSSNSNIEKTRERVLQERIERLLVDMKDVITEKNQLKEQLEKARGQSLSSTIKNNGNSNDMLNELQMNIQIERESSKQALNQIKLLKKLTCNFCLGDFKSLKELRKSKEIPKFKFSSEVVKDLLDQKSMMYLPSLHQDTNTYQRSWRMKIVPLKHPASVRFIKDGLDKVRSQSFNILQTIKNKNIIVEQDKMYGKEGPETDAALQPNIDKLYQDYSVSNAELEKYRKIQKEYLEFLVEMGFPIPKDKGELFKVLILRDYFSQDDREKKRQHQLEMLEQENKRIHKKLQQIDRKQERKIISEANKNFNIHLHANRLLKEDQEYLLELNDTINKKIQFFVNPSLIYKLQQNEKKVTQGMKKNVQVDQPNDSLTLQKRISEMKVGPTTTKTVNQVTFQEFKITPQGTKLGLKNIDKNGNIPTFVSQGTMRNLNLNYQNYNQLQLQSPMHDKFDKGSPTIDRKKQKLEELQNQLKEYFNKLYRRNKIKRRQAQVQNIFKKNVIDDQFEFFLKLLKEKDSGEKKNVDSLRRHSQNTFESEEIGSEDQNENIKLSEMFISNNRLLPDHLFSTKRFKEYSMGLGGDESNQNQKSEYFTMSKSNARAYEECQQRLEKIRSDLDDKAKDFYMLALRDDYNQGFD